MPAAERRHRSRREGLAPRALAPRVAAMVLLGVAVWGAALVKAASATKEPPAANVAPTAKGASAKSGPAAKRARAAPQPEKRYPLNRAAELKARLLERPGDPAAPGWAAEYASSPEVSRLDPVARAAERAWAARAGLAAGGSAAELAKLREILGSPADCPLDSVALKRAAHGVARVGVVVPLSGKYERFGRTFVNGLRIAVEEHNRAWAPSIGLILHDSEGDPLVGARKARWLLKDHGVSLLVGEILSTNTAPLAAATQVLGAVLISPSATNERLAILGEGVFQLHIGPNVQAAALARHLAGEAPRASVALLVAKTREDSAQAAAVVKACDFAAVRVVGIERVREAEADLTKPLRALQGKRPTALVLIGSSRMTGLVGAQLRSTWPDARVYGFQSLDPEELNSEAREGLEGAVVFLSEYALDGAPADSFRARYGRAHADPPTRMAVRGYLTGLAIARALESGCLTASQLREALRAQVYETAEERALRALKPSVAAFPERMRIRQGKAVPLAEGPVGP